MTTIARLWFFCAMLFPTGLLAQDSLQTFFKKPNWRGNTKLGVFVAPSVGLGYLDGDPSTLFYLRGGVSVGEKLSLGGYYSRSLNRASPASETMDGIYLDFWHTGGVAELTVWQRRLVHLTFPVMFGYGELEMDSEGEDVNLGEANFFHVEPSAILEVNLWPRVRLNAGMGYRWVSPVQYRQLNEHNLMGFTGSIGLKVFLVQ